MSGGRCMRPGQITNNGFFNFLRVFRQQCCGMTMIQTAVEGAKICNRMSCSEEAKYRPLGCGKSGGGKTGRGTRKRKGTGSCKTKRAKPRGKAGCRKKTPRKPKRSGCKKPKRSRPKLSQRACGKRKHKRRPRC